MTKPELTELIARYERGDCSEAEKALLESWYIQFELKGIADLTPAQLEEIDQSVPMAIAPRKTKLWPRIAVAAAAVAAIVLGVWFFSAPFRHPDTSLSSRTAGRDLNDVAPGKQGATITLANGKVIQLSDKKTGVIIGAGDLTYNDNTHVIPNTTLSSRTNVRDLLNNAENITVTTAKGQTYQLTLPDGTKAWLNAASKISFPSQFIGVERKILVEGEAYFEVAKNKTKPFIVTTKDQRVEVLGTHFNVSAYADEEATKTTLLEGSVRVVVNGGRPATNNHNPAMTGRLNTKYSVLNTILKPNQQSLVTANHKITVTAVNPSEAVAWKDGTFAFTKQPLQEIMPGIARWYNVEVVYQPGFKSKPFTGSVSRFENISSVLRVLELTGTVHFKIEGRRVTVMQ